MIRKRRCYKHLVPQKSISRQIFERNLDIDSGHMTDYMCKLRLKVKMLTSERKFSLSAEDP